MIKTAIFTLLKYISIIFSVLFLVVGMTGNIPNSGINGDMLVVMMSICFALLAIYFQGEQRRETDRHNKY